MTDSTTRVLASYINALADLAQPKASIILLHDQARLNAYQIALAGSLQELPGDMLNIIMSGLFAPHIWHNLFQTLVEPIPLLVIAELQNPVPMLHPCLHAACLLCPPPPPRGCPSPAPPCRWISPALLQTFH